MRKAIDGGVRDGKEDVAELVRRLRDKKREHVYGDGKWHTHDRNPDELELAAATALLRLTASLAAEGAGGGETIAKQAEVIRSMQAGRAAVVEECARLCDEKAISLHHVAEKMTPKSSRVVDDTRLVGAAYSAAAAAIRSIVNLQESIKT